MELHKQIKAYRHKAGMDQIELAEKSGLSRSFISLLERGHRDLTVKTLLRIFQAMDIDVNFVMYKHNKKLVLRSK